ncbi:MAG: anti-sigma factor family protein [Phycisphaerae bacterium]
MNDQLRQSEFEQVSAYFDGQMTAEQAQAFEQTLSQRPDLAKALNQLRRLDQAMDSWKVPAGDADLACRVLAGVRRSRTVTPVILRLVRWGGAVAAAAAIVVAALVWTAPEKAVKPGEPVAGNPPAGEVVEDLCVRNLDMIENYQVLVDFDTLEAIDRIESETGEL